MASVSELAGFWPDGVTFLDDVAPAAWLEPRLLKWGGALGTRVGAVVPTGYPAYVRVLHDLGENPDRPRWKNLSEAGGLVYHPLIQWDRLPLPVPTGGGSPDLAPSLGQMDVSLRRALAEHLSTQTSTPGSVYFGMWEGWGELHPGGSGPLAFIDDPGSDPPWRPVSLELFHQMVRDRPRFTLPGRAYLLAYGTLDDLPRFPRQLTPSFVWPQDHSFCCATEVDFDSTLVGLSEAGAQRLLADESLEALPVGINDRLDIRGDTINPILEQRPD